MDPQKLPARIVVLIAIHVVSTVVMVGLVWDIRPPGSTPDPFDFFWQRVLLGYLLISQIYLTVFWICLGQSAWGWRLVFGPLILGGVGVVFVGFASQKYGSGRVAKTAG